MPVPHIDDNWSLGKRSWARWQSGTKDYSMGSVLTPHGIVEVYIQPGDRAHTSLDLVKDGRNYRRRWDKAYSRRHVVTLACRFAEEICGT